MRMRRKKRLVQRLTKNMDLREQANKRLIKYKEGLDQGYVQGLQAGRDSYQDSFEGTSIIIPVCNNVKALKRCLEGIMDHTDLAYEIIVIDNGSTDGLEPYLKQLDGQLRYHVLEQNIGFSGAANRGCMMAKGTTILLLSSCMIPTQNWLENLLKCLDSDNDIGMVGPISNRFTEEQQFNMPFFNLDEMNEFASLNNESDAARWEQTTFLSKECLLFRRKLLERVGYFDEGCQVSPFDEKDYCLRVSMQGFKLKCARDVYVHFHERKAGQNTTDLRDIENLDIDLDMDIDIDIDMLESKLYFEGKWQQLIEKSFKIDAFLSSLQAIKQKMKVDYESKLGIAIFYPSKMVVKGLNGDLYWINDGVRRPIQGEWEQSESTRLSQLDLWRWPVGEPIEAKELWDLINSTPRDKKASAYHEKRYETADGRLFFLEKGKKRLILAQQAETVWGLHQAPLALLCDADLRALPDGLPIIAPISLFQPL